MLKVTTDEIYKLAERLEAFGQTRQEMNEVIAEAASTVVFDHLIELNQSRSNSLGGKRANFYANAAESITTKATSRKAEIAITEQGFALRYYGGTVRPTKAKALAIPARSEAYGLSPREPAVPDLSIFYFKGQSAFAGLQDEEGRVWYWLTKKTEHDPDPSVLPSPDSLETAAADALLVYVESFMEPPL